MTKEDLNKKEEAGRQCGSLSPEAGTPLLGGASPPGAGGLAPPRRGVMEHGAMAGTSMAGITETF